MLLDFSPSDAELIELLKSDDAVAYTIIYNKYFDVLYLHAYQKLRDREEVQDLLHELFAQLWNKRKSLVINSSLSGYLYTSIKNKILDVIAHQEVESKYIKSLQGYIFEKKLQFAQGIIWSGFLYKPVGDILILIF